MAIELIAKIAPKNDGFTGMVDADQVLGGGAAGTLPDACVAASNVSQHTPKVHGPAQHTEGTAWRLLYLDAAGDEAELVLGADGTFLQSEGAAAAPTFGALQTTDIPDVSATYQAVSAKDAASGYAGLTAASKLNLAQMQEVMAYGDLTDDPYADHSARHENAGADEISVAGLSGLLADDQHVLDAEAIAAVEGEATLDLTGDVTIAAAKSLAVDTISEKTGAAGVTLDGVTLKDDAVEVDAIRGLKESGGQALDMGAVADGKYLKRSGTDIVGDTPAGGGGGDHIKDADEDTEFHTEKNADEDKIRGKVAGTERFLLQDSSPHLTLTGDQKISGTLGIKGTTPSADYWLDINPAGISQDSHITILRASAESPAFTANNLTFTGIAGNPAVTIDGRTGIKVRGLTFAASVGTGLNQVGTAAEVIGAAVNVGAVCSGAEGALTITSARGLQIYKPVLFAFGGAALSIPTYVGLDIEGKDSAYIGDAYGVRVGDFVNATGTVRLLEIGPATPYLRLVGGADPAAGDTNLYLKVGGALLQVWSDGGTLKVK